MARRCKICMQPFIVFFLYNAACFRFAYSRNQREGDAREFRGATRSSGPESEVLVASFVRSFTSERRRRRRKSHVEHVDGAKESETEKATYLLSFTVEINITEQ